MINSKLHKQRKSIPALILDRVNAHVSAYCDTVKTLSICNELLNIYEIKTVNGIYFKACIRDGELCLIHPESKPDQPCTYMHEQIHFYLNDLYCELDHITDSIILV